MRGVLRARLRAPASRGHTIPYDRACRCPCRRPFSPAGSRLRPIGMPTTTPTRQSRTRWMPTREPTSRCSWSAFRTAWRWRICSGWATASSRAWSTARAATHPASSSPTPTTPSYCAPRTASSCRASQCWATARAITRTWPSLTRAALSSR
eukprot:scaffold3837_cov110-Isochrysis_galbana.AAC.5